MEGERLAVGGRSWREIVGGVGRQALRLSTGRGNAEDVVVAREVRIVVQPLAILRRAKLLDVFVGVGDPRRPGRRGTRPGGHRDRPGTRPGSVQRVGELSARAGDRNRVSAESDAQAHRRSGGLPGATDRLHVDVTATVTARDEVDPVPVRRPRGTGVEGETIGDRVQSPAGHITEHDTPGREVSEACAGRSIERVPGGACHEVPRG